MCVGCETDNGISPNDLVETLFCTYCAVSSPFVDLIAVNRIAMRAKFASNLSFMFTECPTILGRYKLANESGFRAVESGFPFGFTVQDVLKAKTEANVDQVLINVFTGATMSD